MYQTNVRPVESKNYFSKGYRDFFIILFESYLSLYKEQT